MAIVRIGFLFNVGLYSDIEIKEEKKKQTEIQISHPYRASDGLFLQTALVLQNNYGVALSTK